LYGSLSRISSVSPPPVAAVASRDRYQITGFTLDESLAMQRSLDALAAFVKRVGLESEEGIVREPEFYRAQTFLALDVSTRRHLDLIKAGGANPKATLLATVDRCRTAMGSRLLARWILAPLVERARTHFEKADEVMARNPRRVVRAPKIMSKYYRAILELLVARGFAAPRTPVRLNKMARIAIILRYAFI